MTGDRTRQAFVTTRWTLVATAADGSAPHALDALAELCQIYWPPLYGYLRRQGHDREQAEDLTQGFFARLLERGDLRAADPDRGRFRSYLLTALKRYAVNEYERETAVHRGGRAIRLSLDFEHAERAYLRDHRRDDSPGSLFDRKWAGIALDRALQQLRDESHRAGKGVLADRLIPYLTETSQLPSYRVVAADLDLSEGAVRVAVHRLRQRFGAILRREIADTVRGPQDVDDELRELLRAVAG